MAKLGDNWSFTLDGSYFYSEATSPTVQAAARPQGTYGGNVAFGPGVPVAILNPISLTNNPYGGFRVPASYPGNPFGVPAYPRALLPDRTGQQSKFETGTTRLVAQLNGTYSGWDINVAGGYTKARETVTRTNFVNYNNWMTALNDPVNPFKLTGGNSEEMMNFVAPKVTNIATNQLNFIQAVASGDLMKLDGGALAMAVGAGYVYQKLDFDNSSECKVGYSGWPQLRVRGREAEQYEHLRGTQRPGPEDTGAECRRALRLLRHLRRPSGAQVRLQMDAMEGSRLPRHVGEGIPRAVHCRVRGGPHTVRRRFGPGPAAVSGQRRRRKRRISRRRRTSRRTATLPFPFLETRTRT